MNTAGSWGTPNGQYHMYDVDRVNKTITRLDRGRNMRSENQRKIIDDFAFKVTRLRYKHPVRFCSINHVDSMSF